jgi:serine/threonine protein kinase
VEAGWGTQFYMSPEAQRGDAVVTEKADVFSFGVCLWQLLTRESTCPLILNHCSLILTLAVSTIRSVQVREARGSGRVGATRAEGTRLVP